MVNHGEWLELRKLREQRGLTKTSLAKLAGYSLGHINDVEVGRRRPTPAVIVAIAKALNVSTQALERRIPSDEGNPT